MSAEALPVVTAVLGTLIRVHHDLLLWLALPDSIHEGIQNDLTSERRFHRPSDDFTGVKIDNDR